MKKSLITCLWFDNDAEAAMQLYVSLLPNSHMGEIQRYEQDSPGGKKKGEVLVAYATVMGQAFMGLNGGPMFKQSEAVSLQIHCDTQDGIDHYWESLLAGGGQPSQCGWLKDRFGVSWQVVPSLLAEVLSSGDAGARQRVTAAFMQMVKFDLAALRAAAKG